MKRVFNSRSNEQSNLDMSTESCHLTYGESQILYGSNLKKGGFIQESDILFQNMIIAERHREMELIYSDAHEINKMTKCLAELVDDQGYVIDDLRNNITLAADNVQKGTHDLIKAEESTDKSCRCELIIAIVITIIVIIAIIAIIIITK